MSKPTAKSVPKPATFLLRDGVLCEGADQLAPAGRGGQLISGASDGLSLLTETGAPIILLVHRSLAASSRAWQPSVRPLAASAIKTVTLDERADEHLHPGKALRRTLQRVARSLDLDLASSVLVCDTWTDAAAASAVGCQPILVMTGRGREQMMQARDVASRPLVWYAADLAMAALSVRAHLELIGACRPTPASPLRRRARASIQTVA